MTDFAVARHNMVERQIRTNKVYDERVLAAMDTVPRERFVPRRLRGVAYADDDLPITADRFLIEPMVFARLLEAAAIGPEDVVLDVGCASGYTTAVIAELAAAVVALESDPALAESATDTLAALGVDNAVVVNGPLAEGYPDQAPYDAIVIAGRVEEVPVALTRQLAEGGRLVTVLGAEGVARAVLMVRLHGVVSRKFLFDAAVPLLPEFRRQRGFVF